MTPIRLGSTASPLLESPPWPTECQTRRQLLRRREPALYVGARSYGTRRASEASCVRPKGPSSASPVAPPTATVAARLVSSRAVGPPPSALTAPTLAPAAAAPSRIGTRP